MLGLGFRTNNLLLFYIGHIALDGCSPVHRFTGLFDVREGITVKNGITYLRRQSPGSDCFLRGAAQAVCPLIPFTSLLLWLILGVGLNVGQSMSLEQDHHWNPGFFT